MSKCNTVTPIKSTFCTNIGNVDYTIFVDLKKLQQKSEAYFNATEVVKQYNLENPTKKKLLSTFTRRGRTKELIENLCVQFCTVKSKIIFHKRDGKANHTWIHKELFLSLMIWLDAKHELEITRFIDKVVKNVDIAVFERSTGKQVSRPMTDQVKILQQKLFEEKSGAAPHIYTTIQTQIRINTSTNDGRELDELTAKELHHIADQRHYVDNTIMYLLKHGNTGREVKNSIRESLNPTKRTKKARKQGLELVAKELTVMKQQTA